MHLGEGYEVAGCFGDDEGNGWRGQQGGHGLGGILLPDFARQRSPYAVDRIGLEEYLRRKHAQAQRIVGTRPPVAGTHQSARSSGFGRRGQLHAGCGPS